MGDKLIETKQVAVQPVWDNEARVGVAESNDVPGLFTEAESSEALVEKLRTLIPELLDANHCLARWGKLTMSVLIRYHREDRAVLHVAV